MQNRASLNISIWIAVTVFVFVLYPLSIGPFARLYNEDWVPEWVGYAYVPVLLLVEMAPESVQNAFNWYQEFWLF